jgi:hypothetical protein
MTASAMAPAFRLALLLRDVFIARSMQASIPKRHETFRPFPKHA